MFFKVNHHDVFIETECTLPVENMLDWIVDGDTIEVWIWRLHLVISRVGENEK
jgi:hypothetical protein